MKIHNVKRFCKENPRRNKYDVVIIGSCLFEALQCQQLINSHCHLSISLPFPIFNTHQLPLLTATFLCHTSMLGMSTLTSAQVELQEQQPPPSTEPAVELPKERLTVDDMLQKYCGEFGPWQLKNFVLVNLSWTLEALHIMVVIFADHEPQWRCVEGVACDRAGKSVCELKPGSWEWVEGRRSSTVAQWGLICGDKYKVGLAQAMFFLGSMMG